MPGITVIGADKVAAKFQQMGKKAATAYCKAALREAAVPIYSAGQVVAPVRSGNLKRNMKIRAGRSGKGMVSVLVGFGRRWFTGKAFYAAFQNFGWFTGRRLRQKLARHAGESQQAAYHRVSLYAGRRHTPGRFFIEAAYESGKGPAAAIAEKKMLELVMKEGNA